MNLLQELVAAVRTLNAGRIRYALVGGLACGIYVEPRATEDIDFLLHSEDWGSVISLLAEMGWHDLAGEMDFANIRIRRLTKIEDTDVLVMDFLLADGDYEQELANAYQLEYLGEPMRVAKPETIIRLKRGRMSDKDRIDIAALEKKLAGQ